MGSLLYETERLRDIDDRVLTHLQVVMSAKLRRQESLFFTRNRPASLGSGRKVMWVHPHSTLEFDFDGGKMPSINRLWIEELMVTINSPGGLRVTDEPADGRASAGASPTAVAHI